ncbi:hypothetical protein HU200_057157 [Digitaria exilis]|uniref:BTB domain-containing protein n=1 Tax=Digitaria exilis TaxID=1010633 RepID=A0A835ABM0_9POAL|nr:hypothetical protein HU200_057157 [Digitaria exilis]
MNHSCSKVREAVSSTIRLHIEGFSITRASIKDDDVAVCFRSRCHVDGHDWEIRFHPTLYVHDGQWYCPALDLVFLGESRTTVMATLSCKVIDRQVCYYGYEDYDFVPFEESKTVPSAFRRPMDQSLPLYIGVGKAEDKYDFHSSLTVDCGVREPAAAEGAIAVPSSGIAQHLGELLRGKGGSDVTLFVSGETFAAHKSVLAARCSVFMAKFFTGRGEDNSLQRVVEIQDMDAAVFKAMLRFIYTDEASELDVKLDAAAMTFAQHLLIAAGRYGLDRLKVMCERTIALGMDASTVASTLALAEQRNFPRLKAKCINFIAEGSPENLDAVLATEGDLKDIRVTASDLHQHLNGFLQSQAGADITFCMCGESFAAHKNILAARSPVFKAEFFGEMEEKTYQCVEIQDMDAQAVAGTVMAQHLLVAADRFGLDRLKVICEHRLSICISIDTVASTFALAELFNCSQLKTKCIEFINRGSPENLDAVTATEGYRHLEESNSFNELSSRFERWGEPVVMGDITIDP